MVNTKMRTFLNVQDLGDLQQALAEAQEIKRDRFKYVEMGRNKTALLVFNRNEAGNAFWERQGFTVRDDVTYRNKELTEMIRIDT